MAARFRVVVRMVNGFNPANPSYAVFGYKSNLAVIDEENQLSIAWRAQLAPEVIKIMNNNQAIDRVEIYNVDNGTGYNDYVYAAPILGLRTGDALPLYNTYGFQYNRVNAHDRNGFKRIGYVTETDQSAGGPTAAMVTVLNACAVKLGTPLKIGAIDTWFPVTLSRPNVHHAGWTDYSVLNVTFKRITTQNSRKH
jgi:hypothetical protein